MVRPLLWRPERREGKAEMSPAGGGGAESALSILEWRKLYVAALSPREKPPLLLHTLCVARVCLGRGGIVPSLRVSRRSPPPLLRL